MSIDLIRYLARIGYDGPLQPNAALLHALTQAHTSAIPFENLDVLLKRPIRLELDAVFEKLVNARRGGYCFEQNGLFLQVLQQLGYHARPLAARVRLRAKDRSEIPVRTHLFIAVELDGQTWLTDVGIGGLSLTGAILWQANIEQDTPHEKRRLQCEQGRWFHQAWQNEQWVDVYEFTGEPMLPPDCKVASWYTSTHPDSSFMQQRVLARALPNGGRLALLGNELRQRNQQGEVTLTIISDDMLPSILQERFGLPWPL